jgi:type II secretory pathway component HofQ
MRALLIAIALAALAGTAAADRDLCTPGTKFRGQTLDLDVKAADIRDVFRLLADVSKTNLVVADDVQGKVTLRLKRVPWDQIACTVAAVQKLSIVVQDSILMVTKRK